jgi:hypothetical protein
VDTRRKFRGDASRTNTIGTGLECTELCKIRDGKIWRERYNHATFEEYIGGRDETAYAEG